MTFHYSAHHLLHVHKVFREHPEAVFTVPGVWPEERLTWPEWRAWFLACLDRKISAGGSNATEEDWRRMEQSRRRRPGCGGRKGESRCADCGLELRRAASALNRPRLVIGWLPPCLKQRFAHRLRERMED